DYYCAASSGSGRSWQYIF
nr:immunoglobulin light chain junction region [Macaca mulatta]MOW00270.1 immunoglobulin light chain junction region [Macaca mulatta]MOW00807.1 immunoglobulin light chain junction region [Macaca mulatta]MOW00896.1 immunoglobulin light chain junction region [Macaca mulatta]MOW01969.1 immunoglobulin light chain junction region [Macaca mulatta]